jgi:hypothetical protein
MFLLTNQGYIVEFYSTKINFDSAVYFNIFATSCTDTSQIADSGLIFEGCTFEGFLATASFVAQTLGYGKTIVRNSIIRASASIAIGVEVSDSVCGPLYDN